MSDTAAATAATGKRQHIARVRLVVAKYVGHDAADAAVAIRRAGLRPGLERSFGCEPETLGQVVAQEPPAGSEVAGNAMVTLDVAAPGPMPVDNEEEADGGRLPEPERPPSAAEPS
jgi:beta-lactam-binding protein with PASTA domain